MFPTTSKNIFANGHTSDLPQSVSDVSGVHAVARAANCRGAWPAARTIIAELIALAAKFVDAAHPSLRAVVYQAMACTPAATVKTSNKVHVVMNNSKPLHTKEAVLMTLGFVRDLLLIAEAFDPKKQRWCRSMTERLSLYVE